MKNFPVVTVNAYEGTLTRYTDAVTPTGGIAEGAAVYSAPIEKGDLVKIRDHTTAGLILVERHTAANESGDEAGNMIHGIAVSAPFGVDNSTTSSGTPTAAYQRKVDVAFFGIGIVELEVDSATAISPGDLVGLDENEDNHVKTSIAYASMTADANGGMIALGYAAAAGVIPVLVGASVYHDAD